MTKVVGMDFYWNEFIASVAGKCGDEVAYRVSEYTGDMRYGFELRDSLENCFIWSDTPEGYDYWNNIYKQI